LVSNPSCIFAFQPIHTGNTYSFTTLEQLMFFTSSREKYRDLTEYQYGIFYQLEEVHLLKPALSATELSN
jgi:hypothetical protein